MRFSTYVTKEDVEEAVRLIKVATQQAATDPKTGLIDMDIIGTGTTSLSRANIEDIISIMHAVKEKGASIIVTTEKDWVKIYALLRNTEYENRMTWMIIQITFACTSNAEERILLHTVRKKIISWYLNS